jgi:hypothetical protein
MNELLKTIKTDYLMNNQLTNHYKITPNNCKTKDPS